MRFLQGRLRCFARWFSLLFVLLLFPGCRTAHEPLFTTSGAGWSVREGQAVWRPRRQYPELAGDLVMASDKEGRSMVQFSKTPMSLVLAQTTRTNWLIEFPPRRMSFTGRGKPSTRFAWLYLQAALSSQPLPASFRFERKADGGWRLENTKSGETLEGFLAP